MLNSKYFTTVSSKQDGDFKYSIVRPKDSPLILFSKIDGLPLASIHFRCQESPQQNDYMKTRGQSLFTKRPFESSFKCDFQGIVDREGQEFEFVITNLNKDGMINFNILKQNSTVSEVNPGGLNEVNELRSFESVAIKCDQNDNKSMILNVLTKTSPSDKTKKEKVTVEEDESSGNKPTGSYFYLSVVPQIDRSELVERFKETFWACADFFVIKEKVQQYQWGTGYSPHPYLPNSGMLESSHFRNMSYNTFNNMSRGQSANINISSNSSNYFRTEQCAIIPESAMQKATHDMDDDSDDSSSEECDLGGGLMGDDGWCDFTPRSIKSEDKEEILNALTSHEIHIDTVDDSSTRFCDERTDSEHTSLMNKYKENSRMVEEHNSMRKKSMIDVKKSKPQTFQTIQDSYAGKIEGGRKIDVHSAFTGVEYAYDTAAEPCVIGLSISDKVVFRDLPSQEYMTKVGSEMIEDFIKSQGKEFLDKLTKVYEEATCIICLDDDEKPDTIFYQCGHKCIHQECMDNKLDKCPLCRNHITASIKV